MSASQIEAALPSPIDAVPIVATKEQVFKVINFLLVYYQIMYQGKHNQCQLTTSLP